MNSKKSSKKNLADSKGFGIERSGIGWVQVGKLSFAFPTKELADEWLQFAAKLGADFGTFACAGTMQEDSYNVTDSRFGYAEVDSPDAEKNYYYQKFNLVEVSGIQVITVKPHEMTLEQAEELLRFMFIESGEADQPDHIPLYAKRLLRCLNDADKKAYNRGYKLFNPSCCYWDQKEIVIPDGTTEIAPMEYENARKLESVIIPEGVVKIGDGAFYNCDNLETVQFPSTLKEIEGSAFRYCSNLKALNLPDGLEKLGVHAFEDKWYSNKKVLECSDLSELSSYSWKNLIVEHPELGDRCTCWGDFDSSEWEDILKVAPQYAGKCKIWNKFRGYQIVEVLTAQPRLIAKWKSLAKLDAGDWSSLLEDRPEFADRCKLWDKFSAGDWSHLLKKQPQFADRCNCWEKFEDDDWERIIEKGAKFKKLRKQFGPKQLSGYPVDYVRGAAKGLYCVIDVSGGKNAKKFPVTYLNEIPDGGWTEEYKTSKIALRLVAPTTFSMGSKSEDDNPVHQVKLTRPYYIGVFEITQKQWELVEGRNPSKYDDEDDSELRPVENVSYQRIRGDKNGLKWPASASVDKDSFLGILRMKSGIKNIDLPTEAEWARACVAGIEEIECSGESKREAAIRNFFGSDVEVENRGKPDAITGIAWTEDNSGEETHPVGGLASNGLGLYDVLGNVWEWCVDRYGIIGKSKVVDPVGYSVGSKFTSHGACCYNGVRSMNSANRSADSGLHTGSGLGLRLAITVEEASKELLNKASEIKKVRILGNWSKFTASQWCSILKAQPQFADKCDKWDRFDASGWSRLLVSQPKFADKCNIWKDFGACHWARLIAVRPEFAEKCDKFDIFDGQDWACVIAGQPQLASLYLERKKKGGVSGFLPWSRVLMKQPQLADSLGFDLKSNRAAWLQDFPGAGGSAYYQTVDMWLELLIAQPQFAVNCPCISSMSDIELGFLTGAHKRFANEFLKIKKPCAWAVALALSGCPELSKKIQLARLDDGVDDEQGERVFSLPGFDVCATSCPSAYLLRNQPSFFKQIDVSKFSCEDWLSVLQKQPQLADKCDWEKIEAEWDCESHSMYLDSDELRSIVRKNTDIDVTEQYDIDALVKSPMLLKEFDSGNWNDPSLVWCSVLAAHPEMAEKFERDTFNVRTTKNSDDGKVYINFCNWNDWGESKWSEYEKKLALHDSGIDEQFAARWGEAIDDDMNDGFNQVDFLVRACKRNADWAMLVSWEWPDVLREIPNLIEKPGIVDSVVKYCNDCDVEGDGFYEDDWGCELYTQDGEEDGTVNRWAYLLMQCPQLSDRCKTYEKFNGYSRCRLIEKNKMFAEKFSMEELGDPKSAFWSTCSHDDYSSAWDRLVVAYPEFSKYRIVKSDESDQKD